MHDLKIARQKAWIERRRAEGALAPAEPAPTPKAAPVPAPAAAPVRLPAWPESVRAVPNGFLRSALFGAIKRGARAHMSRQTLAAVNGAEIIYTGERLDQGDLDVWSQCLHIARTHDLGLRVQFNAREFLREIDRSGGGHDIEWLKRSLARLMECTVWIKDGKRAYSGHLLDFAGWDDETEHFAVEISRSAASLYGTDGWTAVELTQRQALKEIWLGGCTPSMRPTRIHTHTRSRPCTRYAEASGDGSAASEAICGTRVQSWLMPPAGR